MRPTLFLVIVILFLLAGCSSKSSSEIARLNQIIVVLENENAELRNSVAQLEEQASQEAKEQQAVLVARTCDFLIPICPDALAEPGRKLMNAGVLVNDRLLPYWHASKFIAVVMMPAMLLLLGYILWVAWAGRAWRKISAAKTELEQAREEARKLVLSASRKATDIVNEATRGEADQIRRAKADFEDWQRQIELSQAKLQSLNEEHQAIEKRIVEAEKALQASQTAEIEARRALEMHRAAYRALGGYR